MTPSLARQYGDYDFERLSRQRRSRASKTGWTETTMTRSAMRRHIGAALSRWEPRT
jgi:hypothetical protein